MYPVHTKPLFKKLKILNVTDMLKLHELKLYYKYVHTTLPVYLQNLPFILNKTVHTFNKRIDDNIHTNRAKHDFAKQCIRHDIPLLINNATFNIRNKITTHSLPGFISYKTKITKHCAFTKLLYMSTFITINVLIYSVSFCIPP